MLSRSVRRHSGLMAAVPPRHAFHGAIHMSRNLASLRFSPQQLAAIDQSLSDLENHFAECVDLTLQQRRSLKRMGDKSEGFCRVTLMTLAENPQVVPPGLNLPDAQGDLETLDQLRPRAMRLLRLSQRAADTQTALGCDVMAASLQGYTMLKSIGRHFGLERRRKELGERFSKSVPAAEADAA